MIAISRTILSLRKTGVLNFKGESSSDSKRLISVSSQFQCFQFHLRNKLIYWKLDRSFLKVVIILEAMFFELSTLLIKWGVVCFLLVVVFFYWPPSFLCCQTYHFLITIEQNNAKWCGLFPGIYICTEFSRDTTMMKIGWKFPGVP